jgi:hypothetical protein
MQRLLLLQVKIDFAKALQYYVYSYIICLLTVYV